MLTKLTDVVLSFLHLDLNRQKTLTELRHIRETSEMRIQNMVADLNGCGDEWFLIPKTTLNDCLPKDEDLKV